MTASFTYDTVGNRLTKMVNGTLTTYGPYDEQNRLTQEVTGATTVVYGHDRNGNQVSRTVGSTQELLKYDYRNRLETYRKLVSGSETVSWLYRYTPTGERLAKVDLKTSSENEEWFMSEGDDVSADYTRTSNSTTYQVKRTYVNGPGIDSKIARIEATSTEAVYFYLGDAIGSLHEMIDVSGTVTRRVLSTAWGEDLPGFTPLTTTQDRHGLAQRERDDESGLVHMRARAYDPRSGRFIQTDPIVGNRPGEHYNYARNNPALLTDPRGLEVQGHHIVPKSVFNRFDFAPDVKLFFGKQTIIFNGHDFSGGHFNYNRRVRTLLNRYLFELGRGSKLTTALPARSFTIQHAENFIARLWADDLAGTFLVGQEVVKTFIEHLEKNLGVRFEYGLARKVYGFLIRHINVAVAVSVGVAGVIMSENKADAFVAEFKSTTGIQDVEGLAKLAGQQYGKLVERASRAAKNRYLVIDPNTGKEFSLIEPRAIVQEGSYDPADLWDLRFWMSNVLNDYNSLRANNRNPASQARVQSQLDELARQFEESAGYARALGIANLEDLNSKTAVIDKSRVNWDELEYAQDLIKKNGFKTQ